MNYKGALGMHGQVVAAFFAPFLRVGAGRWPAHCLALPVGSILHGATQDRHLQAHCRTTEVVVGCQLLRRPAHRWNNASAPRLGPASAYCEGGNSCIHGEVGSVRNRQDIHVSRCQCCAREYSGGTHTFSVSSCKAERAQQAIGSHRPGRHAAGTDDSCGLFALAYRADLSRGKRAGRVG